MNERLKAWIIPALFCVLWLGYFLFLNALKKTIPVSSGFGSGPAVFSFLQNCFAIYRAALFFLTPAYLVYRFTTSVIWFLFGDY